MLKKYPELEENGPILTATCNMYSCLIDSIDDNSLRVHTQAF